MKRRILTFVVLFSFLGSLSLAASSRVEPVKNVNKAPKKVCTPWDKNCDGIPDILQGGDGEQVK